MANHEVNTPVSRISIVTAAMLLTMLTTHSAPVFDNNSANAVNVPFIHATNGTLRIFLGQSNYVNTSFSMSFTTESLLGITCVHYAQTGIPAVGLIGNDMSFAADTNKNYWIFKFVTNGVTLFQADSLATLMPVANAPIVEFQILNALMTGGYHVGSSFAGSNGITAQIISTNTTLLRSPDYKFVSAKLTYPSGRSSWYYFNESGGTVLDIWDSSGDQSADGWALKGFGLRLTCARLSSNSFVATLFGLISNNVVFWQSSSNLQVWTPYRTNTATSTTLSVTNAISSALHAQYLRALLQ